MSEILEVKMPSCNWCNRRIAPGEDAVKFSCPGCVGTTIWRCERCRRFGRPYKCPKCGFLGP